MGTRHRFARMAMAGLIAATGVTILMATSAAADHRTNIHWHDRTPTFLVGAGMTSGENLAVRYAAKGWRDGTRFEPTYGGTTTDGNTEDSRHVIKWGVVPMTWWDSCPPGSGTLACARIWYNTGTLHISDADIVIVSDYRDAFTTDTFCDPISSLLSYDLQSVVAHEFGHWVHLAHSLEPPTDTIMNEYYSGCARFPKAHDVEATANTYVGHA